MSKQKGTKINPLFDYILIKPLAQEEVTSSGIVLPDSVKEKPQMGEVMAVGPGAHNTDGKLMPMLIKVGQKVMYKKWGGNEIKVGYEEWLLVEQKDIMAVVE
jgi:chaperonin GroES